MSYLNAYGKKRRFQEGGVVRLRLQFKQVLNKAGGGQEEILALAQATEIKQLLLN
jgi:hypothetical protein